MSLAQEKITSIRLIHKNFQINVVPKSNITSQILFVSNL